MAPIIETRALRHVYGAGTPFEHVALDDVDFTAERGELIAFIGHTGSGKSTFVQHLNGLLKPASGQVLFEGEDIWSSKEKTRAVRSKVGLVFQYPEYQLFEETVRKDIAFGPKNMGLSAKEIEERVLEAAEFSGVPEEVLDVSPFELSGGQKRRVAIAGVMAMRPSVLILDEPTAGLDPSGRESVLGNIDRYHRSTGSTVMIITHDMDTAARIADRLVVFNHSKIAMSGAPAEVFAQDEKLFSMGLAVPSATRVAHELRLKGLDINAAAFTVEQVVEELLRAKEAGTC